MPSGADLDVRWLQIAVDDALLVRGFEGLGDLLRDRQRLIERDWPARDALGKIFALDELHDESRAAVGVFESVDGADVRVIQGRQNFSFALKAGQPIGIGRQ